MSRRRRESEDTNREGIQEGLRDSMVICQILLGFKQDTTEESLVAVGVGLLGAVGKTPVPAASDESMRVER